MLFLLGLLVGSILGFMVACFCNLAARKVSCLPTQTARSEAIEEVA